MVLGKRVVIFDWEWGPNSAPEMGRKSPVITNQSLMRISVSHQMKIKHRPIFPRSYNVKYGPL